MHLKILLFIYGKSAKQNLDGLGECYGAPEGFNLGTLEATNINIKYMTEELGLLSTLALMANCQKLSQNMIHIDCMKLSKPIFTLNPVAFQIYCYLWKKLELLPENAQVQRVIVCSKAELTRELNHSINTIRQALDTELENSFRFVRKLPNDPEKAQNRILLCDDKEWNWDLIRGLYKARTAKERRHSFDSLFDDLSISDPRSGE